MNKDLIFETFNLYISTKNPLSENKKKILNKLNLCEKLFLVDIILTYNLFKLNNIYFDFNTCYFELYNTLFFYKNFVLLNMDKFNSIHKIILNTLKTINSFNKKATIGFGFLDSYIFLNLLIKSIHFLVNIQVWETSMFHENALSKSLICENLNYHTLIFDFFKNRQFVLTTCFKLILALDFFIIELNDKKNLYFKFNFTNSFGLINRIIPIYSINKFKAFRAFWVGDSYLTLTEQIQKHIAQHNKVNLSSNTLEILNNKPISIPENEFNWMCDKVLTKLNLKYNLTETSFTLYTIYNMLECKYLNFVKQMSINDVNNTLLDLQYIVYMLVLENTLKVNTSFYISHYYLWNGSIQTYSFLGFLNFRGFGFILKPCVSTINSVEFRKSTFLQNLNKLNISLPLEWENNFLNPIDRVMLYILLNELGKLNINAVCPDQYIRSEFFIEKGLVFYQKREYDLIDLKIFDYLYCAKIIETIDTFLKKKQWQNFNLINRLNISFFQYQNEWISLKDQYYLVLNNENLQNLKINFFILMLFFNKNYYFNKWGFFQDIINFNITDDLFSIIFTKDIDIIQTFIIFLKTKLFYKPELKLFYIKFIKKFKQFCLIEVFDLLFILDQERLNFLKLRQIAVNDGLIDLTFFDLNKTKQFIRYNHKLFVYIEYAPQVLFYVKFNQSTILIDFIGIKLFELLRLSIITHFSFLNQSYVIGDFFTFYKNIDILNNIYTQSNSVIKYNMYILY